MLPAVSRRSLLLSSGATVAGVATASPADAGSPRRRFRYAYVGSRTTKARNARGAGITVWRIDARTTRWDLIQTVPADDGDNTTPPVPGQIPVNPSFLTLSADQRHLYAVHGDATQVSAFTINPKTGHLTLLNTVDTGRRNPVHLCIDPTGQWLIVANLAPPGCITSLPIAETGHLGNVTAVLDLPGAPGPHKTQQLGANPHHVRFDPTGRWIAIPDRGLDRIFIAGFDPATGHLTLNQPGWTSTRELEGPRHIAFHPTRPLAYVVNELRSTVTTYRWDADAGTLAALQVLPAMPPTMTADSRAAEIVVAPSGQYVYVSNRSGAGDATPGGPDPDTIAVYRVHPGTGTLTAADWISTEGIRPRFFDLDPTARQLYAANEVTDTIAGFATNDAGGHPRPHGIVARTGSPVCIVFHR